MAQTETVKLRFKAAAKITSEGWKGILIVHRGEDTMRKYGPPRTSLDEAEADAMAMLEDFQKHLKPQGDLP